MNKAMLLKQYMFNNKKKSGRLPSAYQEVEYIESTGTQYINSGYVPNSNTRYEIDCYSFVKSDFNMMGITSYETNGRLCFGLYGSNTSTANQYFGIPTGNIQGSSISAQRLTWTIDIKNGTYTNGVMSGSFGAGYTYSNSKNVPFFFFVRADYSDGNFIPQSTAVGFGWFKVYGGKFYENNILVRDYIPCYRKSDNEVGLYDIVNNQFYTNQGTGSFLCGRPLVYDTIAGYEQLDYIESSGTQYIDTQVKANSNTTTELIVTLNKSIGGYLYGAFDSWADKMYDTFYNTGKAIAMGFGAEWLPYNSSLDWNKVHSIKIDNKKLYLDNVQVKSSSETFDFGSYNIYIFTLNDKGKPTEELSSVKCHYFKIINNGTLVREFIPMRRLYDNELGLYDIVNKVFYTNQGSGKFIAGEVLKA